MVFCTNCGKELPEGIKFCPKCGNPMGQEETVVEEKNEVVEVETTPPAEVPVDNTFYTRPDKSSQDNQVMRVKAEKIVETAGIWKPGMIVGIVSIVLAIAGICVHVTWPSTILSIVALVLGIICLVKKSRLSGFAIAGIVIAVLNFVTYSWGYEYDEKQLKEQTAKIDYLENEVADLESAKTSSATPLSNPFGQSNNNAQKSENFLKNKDSAEDSTGVSDNASDGLSDSNVLDNGGVDPDLKAFLDSYEEFMDEYVDFMQKYNANPTDLTLLGEYADMMQKYSDFAAEADKYDSKEMSTADAAYYLEVTNRITQKMLKVYSN